MLIRSVFTFSFSSLIAFPSDCADPIIAQVHPDVRKYTLNARRTATTVEQLEAQLMSPPVVATTCLSIDQYVTLSST